eukprot:255668-Chlamydomonas_euryale.AAC.2
MLVQISFMSGRTAPGQENALLVWDKRSEAQQSTRNARQSGSEQRPQQESELMGRFVRHRSCGWMDWPEFVAQLHAANNLSDPHPWIPVNG